MKNSIMGLVIGILIVLVFIISVVNGLSHPNIISIINTADLVTNLAYVAFGVFLIAHYLTNKQKEEIGEVFPEPVPDSQEDIELLKKRQNRIFGYTLTILVIGSLNLYILNDYSAGLTVTNLIVSFDLLVNVFFAYAVIRIIKNKEVSNLILYTSIIYIIGAIIIAIARNNWYGSIENIILSLYLICAVKLKINRRNYRIINYIVFPILIILALGVGSFSNRKIDKMWKQEAKLEQESFNIATDINVVYSNILTDKPIEQNDVEYIKKNLDLSMTKEKEIITSLENIRAEYKSQLPNEEQIKNMKYVDNLLISFGILQKQSDKLEEFMNYYATVDPKKLSESQKTEITSYKRQMEEFNSQMREASLNYNN